jgi:tetratricopeptide (TPR) repeat protein
MAEGMLGGILGGEDEKPEVEAPEALAGAEAFAAATAAIVSRQDPQVARDTSAFLKKQTELLETQNEHLKDEHALRIAHLRNVLSEENTRRLGLRLRVGLQCFLALLAIVIVAGIGVMVHDAFKSRGVVIEPFEISPNIASFVPSGRIVAGGLLDNITQLQAAAHLRADQKSALSNVWSQEASVTIPEAGASLAQIEQFLRQRLGNDVRVSGDLVRSSADGIALTVRGSKVLPKTFSGSISDLDGLLHQAAEYLYGEANILAFTQYLLYSDQHQRVIDFVQSHLSKAPESDRGDLLDDWADSLVNKEGMAGLDQANKILRQAIRTKPDTFWAYSDLISYLQVGGDEEGAARIAEQEMKAAGGRANEKDPGAFANVFFYTGDFLNYRQTLQMDIDATQGGSFFGGNEQLSVAIPDVQLHDMAAADALINTTILDSASAADTAIYAAATALRASEHLDFAEASKAWDKVIQVADVGVLMQDYMYAIMCRAAVDYERTGQHQKADAALDTPKKILGVDSYVDCYRSRADVLDLRGDWKSAQEWYGKAIKLAPSIPSGYYSYGAALLKHGDLKGAEEQLKLANEKGPHWADPLKVWGDLLVKQGTHAEALAKYDEALKYAPNWMELKEARAALSKQKS